MTVYTKYITLRNGQRIYAADYGLEAFRFEVTPEEYQEYLEKQKKRPNPRRRPASRG